MVEVDVLVENQNKQHIKVKVMKVWKYSDIENSIIVNTNLDEVSGIHFIKIIVHFQLFYSEKIHRFCRCFIQSRVYPLLQHFSSGTSSKSQEITIAIAGLRFRDMAHSELLHNPSNNVGWCFATYSAMLDYQCSVTRRTMFDSLTKTTSSVEQKTETSCGIRFTCFSPNGNLTAIGCSDDILCYSVKFLKVENFEER